VHVLEVLVNLRPRSPPALHFETIDLSARNGNSQTISFAVHAAILLALILLATVPKPRQARTWIPEIKGGKLFPYMRPASSQSVSTPSDGSKGGGGEHDLRPPTSGRLAPGSSMLLVPPRKILNDHPQLPEPPAVFDPNAPAVVTDLGLPWMKEKNDSAGPGSHHGIGSGDKGGMGDDNFSGAGQGHDNGPYANVVTQVACLYCPEPPYTEEARKAKLQGEMLLQDLVGEDGKAKQVRILRTLGLGLDESAEQVVYSWRFSPARDANKRPVTAWVTIETRFQLF
jgi:periplasmic protein TonB